MSQRFLIGHRCTVVLITAVSMLPIATNAQPDSVIRHIQLAEFVVDQYGSSLDLEGIMRQVMDDTTFHHAFLNTRFFPHAVKSDLRVRIKSEKESASLHRRGRLLRDGAFADLVLDSVHETGRLRTQDGDLRYLTVEMYDDVFFPKGRRVASNRIADREIELVRGSKFEKYKSELKRFMFNPGKEIATVPFIGDKLDLFAPDMLPLYDYVLDSEYRGGHSCWKFTATARDTVDGRPADEDDTVIKRMVTWFDDNTMQVVARRYRIAHRSMILDFDIRIDVENTLVGGEVVPLIVRYDGDWDIPFKQRELVRFVLEYSGWVVE